MLLYWQFNTEPKRGKQNFVYSRRRAPHVESLVAATLQQSKHSTSHRHSVTQPTPKNTKTSQQGHTSPQPGTLKKSPRGVQRGRGFTAPLRFSTASQSKKTRPSAKQESKNKTKNQPHNKQRKRKSQRKIKKKNKRKK